MIDEELNNFLRKKNNLENDNLYWFNLEKKVSKQGIECLKMFKFILKDKQKSNILLQDYILLSAQLRNHIPIKVSFFKEENIIGSYKDDCLEKLYDLTNFIIKTLKEKFDFSDYDSKISVVIKRYNQKPVKIKLRKFTTVKDIKVYFFKEKKNIILIFKGLIRDDDKNMLDLKIKKGDILYLIEKIRQ